jgi:hypothetical protein
MRVRIPSKPLVSDFPVISKVKKRDFSGGPASAKRRPAPSLSSFNKRCILLSRNLVFADHNADEPLFARFIVRCVGRSRRPLAVLAVADSAALKR